jgi:hypothetical protein
MSYFHSPLHFAFKINSDYGFEFSALNKIREYKDGITFLEFVSNLDTYKEDHSPKFGINLVFMNWMIFECSVYYLHHREEENKIDES